MAVIVTVIPGACSLKASLRKCIIGKKKKSLILLGLD